MDARLFRTINGLAMHSHAADAIGRFLATTAVVVFPVALALLWILGRGNRHPVRTAVVVAVAAGGIALGGNIVVAHAWHRARPYAHMHVRLLTARTTDASFPSDHAALAFGIAAAMWPRARRTSIALLACATAVAVARVFVGAHYPGDVLAGAAMGIVAAAGAWRALRKPLDALTTIGEWIWSPVDRLVQRAR